MGVLVRTQGEPTALANAVRAAMRDVDPELTLAGIAVGLGLAWLVSRAIVAALPGTSTPSAGEVLGAAVILAVAAMIAAYVPVRRALRLDPVRALRME